MLIGPTVQMIGNIFVLMNPTSLPVVFTNRFVTAACSTLSGSVTSVSAMSDVCSGAELGMNIATLWAYAGLGVIFGPLAGGQIIARTGDPRYVYLLKSLMGAFHLYFTYTNMVETLPEDKRREFTWTITNPFAFYRLFVGEQTTPTLRKLCTSAMFSSWGEGKNTNDVTQMYVREDVKMSESTISYFVTLYGIIMCKCFCFLPPPPAPPPPALRPPFLLLSYRATLDWVLDWVVTPPTSRHGREVHGACANQDSRCARLQLLQ
jgi:hypothetical protein